MNLQFPLKDTTIDTYTIIQPQGKSMTSDIIEPSNAVMAANFLSGTILVCLSVLAIAVTILVLNNIFVKYWKPIRVFTFVPVNDATGEVIAGKTDPKVKQ